jgi:hypothetical protein
MTIPILPGPFSFLTGAGEALGAFGKGRSERNIYEQQQAQKNVEILTSLIQRGLVDPQVLAAHGTAAMLHSAGYLGLSLRKLTLPKPPLKPVDTTRSLERCQRGVQRHSRLLR